MLRPRGSLKRFRKVVAQRAHPEQLGVGRVSDKRQLVALRRKNGHSSRVTCSVEQKFLWRHDFRVYRYRQIWGLCHAIAEKANNRDQCDRKRAEYRPELARM